MASPPPASGSPPGQATSTPSGVAHRVSAGVNRKESYKAQKRSYAREKKRVERELLSTFRDESIIVLADWLKVRGSLKSWTKLWCVLKPGLLLLYRSPKTKVSNCWGMLKILQQTSNFVCSSFDFRAATGLALSFSALAP